MNLAEIERDSSIYEGFIRRITIDNKTGCWEVSGSKNIENIRRGISVKVNKEMHAKRTPEERKARAKHASSFNVQRNLKRTHCKNGHEVKPENTRIEKNGSRRCKVCLSISNARFISKNKITEN